MFDNIKECLYYVRRHILFITSICLFAFINLVEQLSNLFAFYFLGRLSAQTSTMLFISLMIALIIVKALSIFGAYLCEIISAKELTFATARLKQLLVNKILCGKLLDTQQLTPGDLINCIENDSHAFLSFLDRVAATMISIVPAIVVTAMSLVLCWQLCICSIFIGILHIMVRKTIDAKLAETYEKQEQCVSCNIQAATESIKSMQSVRWMGLQKKYIESFKNSINKLALQKKDTYYVEAKLELVSEVADFTADIVFWGTSVLLLHFSIATLGDVLAINSIKHMFLQPFQSVSKLYTANQKNIVLRNRIAKILGIHKEDDGQQSTLAFKNMTYAIELDNVSFSYGESPILREVSLSIVPGERIRLVGESGKGKSTLAKIIASLYSADDGELRLYGEQYQKIPLKILRREITYVPQNFHIFHDTIFENIRMWNSKKTIEDVQSAAKAAQIDEYICSLPQGYETIITDNGDNLSLGERQRISIARALCSSGNILILDEVTANVDFETGEKIEKVLLQNCGAKSVIGISHQTRTELYDREVYW